jgi:hypothetical protein
LEHLVAHVDYDLTLFNWGFTGIVAAGADEHQRGDSETKNEFVHGDSF